MGIAFKIVNVVATAVLDRSVDLEAIRELFPHQIIYDQDIYGGRAAYFKSKKMQGTVSIFWSGKIISVGTKSVEKAIKELKFVAKSLNANLREEPKIQSIVALVDLKASIDIDTFLDRIRKEKIFRAMYEPEQFPGVILKFPVAQSIEATVLLFSSGKLICLGLTRYDYIEKALSILITKLNENGLILNSNG
jgi:transcription initiation factor TFIID TATA-box-binding protein